MYFFLHLLGIEKITKNLNSNIKLPFEIYLKWFPWKTMPTK